MQLQVISAPTDFTQWRDLYRLLVESFAFMQGRIDPPSSLNSMTEADLTLKAKEEDLFIALQDDALVGCVFGRNLGTRYYVGKLAVHKAARGKGLAKALMAMAEKQAKALGLDTLELETRIELTENHAAFEAMGFLKIAETAHDGYQRPTGFTYQKPL